jgi:glutaredoxin-like protein
MNDSKIRIYAAEWCFDCRRTRKFMEKHQIAYQWIDIDTDKDAEAYVIKLNRGNRSVPTILFPDGSILVEPSNGQLADKLGVI